MEITVRQISSLEKVRKTDHIPTQEVYRQAAVAGQRISYQICIATDDPFFADVAVRSALADQICIFSIKDAVMDTPITYDVPLEDYITHEPGLMPDILIPIAESNGRISIDKMPRSLWVRVDLPKDMAAHIA